MGSIHLYTAISLDGFIADSAGSVAWLDQFQTADYGFAEFLDAVDTIILGRVTYEQVLSFGAWPYAGKRAWILTREPERYSASAPEMTEFYTGDVRGLPAKLAGDNAWLIGGARTNAQFMQHKLIDKLHVAVMPITLGKGLPLFTPVEGSAHYHLIDSRQFDNGVVMMRYQLNEPLVASSPAALESLSRL